MNENGYFLLSNEQGKRIRTLTQNYFDGALTVEDWKRQVNVVVREAKVIEVSDKDLHDAFDHAQDAQDGIEAVARVVASKAGLPIKISH